MPPGRTDVLDHLHRQHHVEFLALVGERFGRDRAIIDDEVGLRRMLAGHRDIRLGGVGAQHIGTQPGERLGQDTAAAADIEDAQAGQAADLARIPAKMGRDLVADIGEPDRIELVQHRHGAALVPPLRGELRKLLDLGPIDGGLPRHSRYPITQRTRRRRGAWVLLPCLEDLPPSGSPAPITFR